MNEIQVKNDDIKLLLSLIPSWAKEVPEGLDPTMYGTGTYDGDLEIKQKVDEIKRKIGRVKKLKPCPFCGRQATIVMHPGNWDVKPPIQEGGCQGLWYVGCSYSFFEGLDAEPICEIVPCANWYADLDRAIEAWNWRAREEE